MRRVLLPFLLLFLVISCLAQTSGTAAVPPLVKFSGTLANTQGTVGVIFALYTNQTGGAPLWLETQNVTPDANGRYTVYLGINHTNGVPMDVFASAEAHWLGVQPEGQSEQARVQLVSVPYALKAADATTLGGQPLSAFVLASNAGTTTGTGNSTVTANAGSGVLALASPQVGLSPVTTSGLASANYMAKFSTSTDVEPSSVIYDSGSAVGIGTTAPQAILHVVSPTSTAGMIDAYSGASTTSLGALPMVSRAARGTQLSPSGVRTNDYLGGLGARAYTGTAFTGGWRAAVLLRADQDWTDTAQGTNIAFGVTARDTAAQKQVMWLTSGGALGIGINAPTALLEVNGTAKFDGLVTFAAGQTFPGATSTVSTTFPLAGDGTAGSPLSIPQAGQSQSGYLGFGDWMTFNNKLNSVVANSPLGGNGSPSSPLNLTGIVPVSNGGTGFSFVGVNGSFLRSNGASLSYGPISSSDLPSGVYVDLLSPQLIAGNKTFSSPASFNVGTNFSNALQAQADAVGAFAILGQTNATDVNAAGVNGNAMFSGTSSAKGVLGVSNGNNGIGVSGSAYASCTGGGSSCNPIGVLGYTNNSGGAGGLFNSTALGGDILRAAYNGGAVFKVGTNSSGRPYANLTPFGTPTTGSNGGITSSMLNFTAAVLDNTTGCSGGACVQNPKFGWRADPINNNASGYGAQLAFYSGWGSANATATGLSINSSGIITFAPNQTFSSTGGITGVTPGPGLTGGGTSGNVTLSVDPTVVQPLLTGLTAGASCGAGNAVNAINSTGAVSCINLTSGGGPAYLPMSTGGQVTGDVSIVPPTTGASSIYGLSVTQNQQGVPLSNPSPAWMLTVPAAIVGTATDASGNVAAGVVGVGTGVGDLGVVAMNNSGVDGPPALMAWNVAPSGKATGIAAQTSSSTGTVIHAEALVSAAPGSCSGSNCDGLKVIQAEADATSGFLTLFDGEARSPNASGINLQFDNPLTTNCAQGTQCPSVFNANVNGVGNFSIDGGLNLNTPGTITAANINTNGNATVNGNLTVNGGINGNLNLNNLNITNGTISNLTVPVGLTAPGGIATNNIGTIGSQGSTLTITAANVVVGSNMSSGAGTFSGTGSFGGPLTANNGLTVNGGGGINDNGSLTVSGGAQFNNGFNVTNGGGNVTGDLNITGNLSKGAGSFKIDHPLDPGNKYLYHSFVESPDMMNIYNGIVVLDKRGQAWVQMPEWFDALNRDFRYQLTAVGAPGPNLYIAQEVSGNRFKVAGGKAGMKVSWQVTGVRQDAYANAHRIQVEENKPTAERGTYLHPELFPEKTALAHK